MQTIRQKRREWTIEAVLAEAEKYTSRTEFSRGAGGAYNKARDEGYIEIACAHMTRKKPALKFTLAQVKAAAKKHKTRSEFYSHCGPEYALAFREGWLEIVCGHMPKHAGQRWDKDSVKKEAAKYKHRVDFMTQSQSAYKRALADGYLDAICKHMTPKLRRSPLTEMDVARAAKKYKYRSDFALKSQAEYKMACRKGWLDTACAHMKPKPRGKYKPRKSAKRDHERVNIPELTKVAGWR